MPFGPVDPDFDLVALEDGLEVFAGDRTGHDVALGELAAEPAQPLELLGALDAFGHVTMRHPTDPNRYLMSRSMAPALVTEADIMEFDLDGNAV